MTLFQDCVWRRGTWVVSCNSRVSSLSASAWNRRARSRSTLLFIMHAALNQRSTSSSRRQTLEIFQVYVSSARDYNCFTPFPTCCRVMSKQQAGSIKIKPKRLSIRRTARSPNRMGSERLRHDAFDQDRETSLPPEVRSRLWTLFAQIEREFECLHAENIACKWIMSSSDACTL